MSNLLFQLPDHTKEILVSDCKFLSFEKFIQSSQFLNRLNGLFLNPLHFFAFLLMFSGRVEKKGPKLKFKSCPDIFGQSSGGMRHWRLTASERLGLILERLSKYVHFSCDSYILVIKVVEPFCLRVGRHMKFRIFFFKWVINST